MTDETHPPRTRCTACGWAGLTSELLTALHPFHKDGEIFGCPECCEVDGLVGACDVPDCRRASCCGFITLKGYRRTCFAHRAQAKEEDLL